MGVDLKYGRVTTERGDIGEDEPVFLFRARDVNLPKLIAYYHLFCLRNGSPKQHLDLILENRDIIMQWQNANSELVRVPTSESYFNEQSNRPA